MTSTPNIGAPLWDSAQSSPWTPHNQALRIFDAFVAAFIVTRMDLTAPPGSSADGEKFLIHSPATGLWAGHDGDLAISVGANASNGWYFGEVSQEGMLLHNRADSLNYRYTSGAWVAFSDAISRLQDLLDVDASSLADGYTILWDASNGLFYFAPQAATIRPIGFFFASTPAASEVLGMYAVIETLTLPANLTGSVAKGLVNPGATFQIAVNRIRSGASVQVANISIATTGVATLTTTGGNVVDLVSGDLLEFVAQSGVDASIANWAVTLKGVR